MGTVTQLFDGLRNALTGQGTRRDARSGGAYVPNVLTQQQIDAAYRGSGLLRKIIQIPALDMVREWRTWTGLDADQASTVYDEEKRLGLRDKVRTAEVLRGLGGGALVMGLPGLPSQPAPSSIGRGTLAFVHVVSRWHLNFAQLQDDATKPGFGEPAMWRMNTTAGQQDIHPSRVIPFRADTTGSLAMTFGGSAEDMFWGESKVAQVLDAVQDSDTARASFAALLHKARLLRIGIPRLMEMVSSGQDKQVMDRLAILATAESLHNATIYDAGDGEKGGEKIDDVTYSFAGAKDVLNAYAEFACAVADIPATRLLGRAPEGMNSSGDSQQQDWRKKIRAMQTLDLAPCLDRLDPYLVASAVGSPVATAANDWAPLDTPGEKENAERFKTQMEAIDKLQATGAVPEQAFSRGVQSLMVEEGYLPELESALAEMPEDERFGIGFTEGGGPYLEGEAGREPIEADPPLRVAANDAKPRPLYVKRDLLNAAELIAWAKEQGFNTTIPAEDMHVTVLYSRNAVDPIGMGETWSSEEDGGLTVKAGGPRAIEQFNEGAVVLQFASSGLQYRHREMVEKGASHDYPEYLPHVTLTYEAPDGVDLDAVKPFAGELRFGPEVFEPLDLDWKSKIEEAE